jgi:4-amino-4-deoxy-L-arabinose transferase-like glycosyltransferase
MRMQIRSTPAFLLIPIAVYLFFSLSSLDLPGLHYDEVLFANAALGNIDGSFVAWETNVAGCRLPVMLMPYLGAIKAYLYYPLFKWWGPGVVAVRLPVILLGLVTLLITYAFVCQTLGPCTALLSVVFLASDPTFIFMQRTDWGPNAVMMILKVASLYFVFRWLHKGELLWLGVACFLMGVGVFDKVIFVWYVAALAVALPLCFWSSLKGRLEVKSCGLALLSFLAGSFPFIVFTIKTRGDSLTNPNLFHLSRLQDFILRWNVLIGTLNGTAVYNFFNNELLQHLAPLLRRGNEASLQSTLSAVQEAIASDGTFQVAALFLSILMIAVLIKKGRLQFGSNVLFCLFLPVLMLGMIFMTPGATGIQHFVTVYPFPHLVIALALCQSEGLDKLRSRRGVPSYRLAAFALGLLFFISQIYTDVRYLQSLRRTGGVGIWSDAIYPLAEYAQNHPDQFYALMDWGFSNQLLVLTQGGIRKEESFLSIKDSPDSEEKVKRMCHLLERPDVLLIFHAKKYEVFPMLDTFSQALHKCQRSAQLVETFFQRDGQPAYLMFKVLPL